MTTHQEVTKAVKTCDRCRKDITGVKLVFAQSGSQIVTVSKRETVLDRIIRKVALTHGRLTGEPKIYRSDIDFCDTCWWEFDRLFCQGQAIAKSEGVREQSLALMPIPDYLDGRERYEVAV